MEKIDIKSAYKSKPDNVQMHNLCAAVLRHSGYDEKSCMAISQVAYFTALGYKVRVK